MRLAAERQAGQTVRLTMPYLDARRGIYTVVYIYRDGWLGVVAHLDGSRHNVPAHVCRPVETRPESAAHPDFAP